MPDLCELPRCVDPEQRPSYCGDCGERPIRDETVFVRVKSHRAADNLKRLLGDDLAWYWNVYDGGEFVLIPIDKLDEARAIKGVTKAKTTHQLFKCWSW